MSIQTQGRFSLMNKYMVLMLITFVCTPGLIFSLESFAAGRTYEGTGEGSAHCTLWSTDRLRWPQTSVGREKQECRRRAVRPTSGVIQCRLRKSYIDQETGERMCIYQRGATGQGDMTTSMSKEFSCERSINCKQE